jgi:hypothetical protein
MSERQRASLTQLKRPLPDRGSPIVPLDQAAATFLTPESRPAAAPEPTPQVPSKLLMHQKKDPKIAWTFKMPYKLHQELSAVAAYNELSMTDIVVEALERHLVHFPHPAGRS